MLKLLADENIARDMVAWLRNQGCDVLHASETLAQQPDPVLVQTAQSEGRLLLTEDKDFGELVFRDHLNSHGIILLRLASVPIAERIQRLQAVWSVIQSNPSGRFIVVTKKRIRVRPLGSQRTEPPEAAGDSSFSE